MTPETQALLEKLAENDEEIKDDLRHIKKGLAELGIQDERLEARAEHKKVMQLVEANLERASIKNTG